MGEGGGRKQVLTEFANVWLSLKEGFIILIADNQFVPRLHLWQNPVLTLLGP